MKRIKSLITILIITLIVVITPNINASSASMTIDKDTMQVGDKATITLNMNALVWNYQFSGGISNTETNIYSLDENDLTNKTTTKIFEFNPTEAGTYTINAMVQLLDEADLVVINGADGKIDGMQTYAASLPKTTTQNLTVTVTVTAPPTNNTDNTNTNNNSNSNTNSNSNSTNNTNKTDTKKETKKEETKQEEKKEENKEIKITKFEIEGYKIDFDSSKTEYTLDIDNETTTLNIKVEGENIQVEGAGEVNIENKNSIKITITKGSEKKEYTIKLNRLVENLAEEPKEEKETITIGKTIRKEEKINIFSILVPIIGIILLILNTILVIKRIKKK